MMPSSRIVALAEAVADGHATDWDEAASSATDDYERVAIARLRSLAEVGELFTAVTMSAPRYAALPSVLPPGTIWGSLRILVHVGRGRFGDVYRAWDPALERDVALKLLFGGGLDERADSAVVHEGRLMARVRHPNVATIHGAQRNNGRTGLWMEFVEGRTLAEEIAERGTLPPAEIARIGVELCRALDAVHQAGLVHRDVKAQNVLRARDGRIVLGDFGTGRDLDDEGEAAGTLAGTPVYLAPEIFDGGRATPQSDLYSLGALLFRLATGAFPVVGRSLRDLRDAHARGVRVDVKTVRPDLPTGLAAAIETALEPDPARRFRTATEFRQAVEAFASQDRPGRWTAGRVAFAAISLLLATAVGFAAWTLRSGPDIPFANRGWAVVSEFENRTGEAVFEGTLRMALERELSVSTVMNVVTFDGLYDWRQGPVGPPGDPSAQPAEGTGPHLVMAGDVSTASGGYLVSIRVTDPADQAVIAGFGEIARDQDHVLDAIARLARRIRQSIGESIPPGPASSFPVSLEALHWYTKAVMLLRDPAPDDRAQALLLLGDVLEHSPQFAPARLLRAERVEDRDAAIVDADLVLDSARNASDPEHLMVTGRAYQVKGLRSREPLQLEQANERAVAAFEALLRLRPDHLATIRKLSLMYRRTGRLDAASALLLRIADLRPASAMAQVDAALELLGHGRLEEAQVYIARARALDAEGLTLPAPHAAWFMLFDAHEAWLRDDARAALDATDRASAMAMNFDGRRLEQAMLHIATMYLTLGRFGQANDAAARMLADEHSPVPDTWRALVLLVREDIPGLRAFLQTHFVTVPRAQQVGSLLIDAGLLAEARTVIAQLPSLHYSSQLLLAEGRLDEAIRAFRLARDRHTLTGSPGRPRTARKLAEALTRKGDTPGAIAALEEEFKRRIAATAGTSAGYEWLMVSEQLAHLYRTVGRVDDAEALEGELLTLLAVADEDHPIKRRLQGPSHDRRYGQPAR